MCIHCIIMIVCVCAHCIIKVSESECVYTLYYKGVCVCVHCIVKVRESECVRVCVPVYVCSIFYF